MICEWHDAPKKKVDMTSGKKTAMIPESLQLGKVKSHSFI